MVYEIGVYPTFNHTEEEVPSSGYTFQKDQWGRIKGASYQIDTLLLNPTIRDMIRVTTEETFAKLFSQRIKEKGADVKYIRVSKTENVPVIAWIFTFTVEDCVFIGDPFIVDDIIMLVLVIAGVSIVFMLLFPAVIYNWAGVNPSDATKYNLAQLIPYFAIGGLILAGIYLYYVKGKGAKT